MQEFDLCEEESVPYSISFFSIAWFIIWEYWSDNNEWELSDAQQLRLWTTKCILQNNFMKTLEDLFTKSHQQLFSYYSKSCLMQKTWNTKLPGSCLKMDRLMNSLNTEL